MFTLCLSCAIVSAASELPSGGAAFEASTPQIEPSAARRPDVDGDRLYLSGRGPDDAVPWEFEVSDGRRAGERATLPVPSQWELHGFGTYAYGFHDDKPHEVGSYRRTFDVPADWAGRPVRLVFEGVMTDASVRLNGSALDPVHRGGFTEFSYRVDELLDLGGENTLEVEVAEHSSERSINRAERDADYWVFGGIFRPVYLEALPETAIWHAAVDAGHGGELKIEIETVGAPAGATLEATLVDPDGQVAWVAGAPVERGAATLVETVSGTRSWSHEHPTLYRLELALASGGEPRHEIARRIGFRTVELRQDGVWINGRRTLLKGINRHSFWPDSGRTLSAEMNRRDAELIRAMNANTVRTSHYPPDRSFLDACDELGLYVIEELPGWHDAYSTEAGRPLVREMVRRDVSRPSIVLWANGNEGGWNRELEPDYFEHDLQQRPVIYPDDDHGTLDTTHYLDWDELRDSLDPSTWKNRWRALWGSLPAVMPTEILHGLYDGGHGAGLEAYWEQIVGSPRGAGLFLWTFLDEAVRRTDRDGELDAHGSYAPDGIVGPYREPEGSFWAVRELWAPVAVERLADRPDGAERLRVENRYLETDLADIELVARWWRLPLPGDPTSELRLLGERTLEARGGEGVVTELALDRPPETTADDLLTVEVLSREGRSIVRYDLSPPLRSVGLPTAELATGVAGGGVPGELQVEERDGTIVVRAGVDRSVRFDAETGALELVDDRTRQLLFGGDWVSGNGAPWRVGRVRVTRGEPIEVQALLEGGDGLITWRVYPSGWIRLHYRVERRLLGSPAGITLPLDLSKVESIRWLGRGPSRAWGNRLHGGRFDVWEGAPAVTGYGLGSLDLSGYWSDVRWLEWTTGAGTLTVVPERATVPGGMPGAVDPGPFVAFEPLPEVDDPRHTRPEVPSGLSVLHAVPGIGTKFHPASDLAPPVRGSPVGRDEAVLWLRWSGRLVGPMRPGTG